MSTTENDSFPEFDHTMIEVCFPELPLKSRTRMVPAYTHPFAPGLAVTMCDFGVFNVTHINSGRTVSRNYYERAVSAVLEMTHWALIADAHGFDFSLEAPDLNLFLMSHGDKPVPFGGSSTVEHGMKVPTTISKWVESTMLGFMDEFPWEQSNPLDSAIDVLKLTQAATA